MPQSGAGRSVQVKTAMRAFDEQRAHSDRRQEQCVAGRRGPSDTDNPFELPNMQLSDGWSAVDGGIERAGGPLVMRVTPSTTKVGQYDWQLKLYSWVEPAIVTVDNGVARTFEAAKVQAFWSAYGWTQSWLKSLSDDPLLGV